LTKHPKFDDLGKSSSDRPEHENHPKPSTAKCNLQIYILFLLSEPKYVSPGGVVVRVDGNDTGFD
jgi:hypothetical protein